MADLRQFRQIYFKTGVVSRAAGSVYAENDGTKVIVAVYGPRPIQGSSEFSATGQLRCDFKLTSFGVASTDRWTAPHEPEDRDAKAARDLYLAEASSLMEQALTPSVRLDMYPKALVEVHALVLQSDGAELAISISAASLALADANVELFDLVAASSVVMNPERGLVLDPSAEMEEQAESSLLVGYMPSLDETTQLVQRGRSTPESLQEGIELCLDGCLKLHQLMRSTLLNPQPTQN